MTRQLQNAEFVLTHVDPILQRIHDGKDMFAGVQIVLEAAKRLAESVKNPHPLSTLQLSDDEKGG